MNIKRISDKKLHRKMIEAKCRRERGLPENNPSSTSYAARVKEIHTIQQEIADMNKDAFIVSLKDLPGRLARKKQLISRLNKLLQENILDLWKGNERLLEMNSKRI